MRRRRRGTGRRIQNGHGEGRGTATSDAPTRRDADDGDVARGRIARRVIALGKDSDARRTQSNPSLSKPSLISSNDKIPFPLTSSCVKTSRMRSAWYCYRGGGRGFASPPMTTEAWTRRRRRRRARGASEPGPDARAPRAVRDARVAHFRKRDRSGKEGPDRT